MTNKRKRSMLVLLLVLALLVTLPASRAYAEDATAIPLTNDLTLTADFATAGFADDPDIANIKLTYELFKVASVSADPAHGMTIKFTEDQGVTFSPANSLSYDNLVVDPATGEVKDYTFWDGLAQQAVQQLLDKSSPKAADASSTTGSFTDLGPGLYLAIARGTDLAIADYLVKDDAGKYTTIAETAGFVYSFTPALIVLPANKAGNMTTGEWVKDGAITFKAAQAPRVDDLVIKKTITNYNNLSPVTIVFRVTATLRGKTVYDNYVSLSFDSATTKQYVIEDQIPIGAEVTVVEVYAGLYTGGGKQTTTIVESTSLDNAATVAFSNAYNNSVVTGYGIENTFTSDGSTWKWKPTEIPWS